MGGIERGIYLAGPVEQDDDPRGWRDRVKRFYPSLSFIDPMDWQDDWHEDPQAVITRELRTVETHPVLVCNVGRDAPRTVGTHHEIAHALAHGNDRVAVVPMGDLPGFIEHRDVRVCASIPDAIAVLVGERVAADGGQR